MQEFSEFLTDLDPLQKRPGAMIDKYYVDFAMEQIKVSLILIMDCRLVCPMLA
jgi:hypothetical protein